MSIRIVGQIFGSIVGTGAVSTGLWFGISKFWNINDSDEAPSELLGEITDDAPVELLAETSGESTDVQTIKANTEITQNTQDVKIQTKTITTPPVVPNSPKFTSEKKPGTHIQKIESYQWKDKELEFDLTTKDGSSLYFLAELANIPLTQNQVIDTFIWNFFKNNSTINPSLSLNIDCQGPNPNCFPIYKFSNNPQKLEEIDFTKLVKLENKENETWQKYLLFYLDNNSVTSIGNDDQSLEKLKKPHNWKEMCLNSESSDSGDIDKNYLNLWLGEEGGHSHMTQHHNFKLKIINFLTPSFDLDKATKSV